MKRLCFDIADRDVDRMRGMAAEEGCELGEILARALRLYRTVTTQMRADPGASLVLVDSTETTQRTIRFPDGAPQPPIANRKSAIDNG